MSRYRKIEVRTWSDEEFRSLSAIPASGQGLWFFLLTGPHTTAIPGLFRAGRAAMAEELDWDLEAFDKAFREVSDQGMAVADFKAKLVWLPKAIQHNKPESPNVVRGWRVELDLLPECDLKRQAVEGIRKALELVGPSYVEAFDELHSRKQKADGKPSPKPYAKPSPNQEQEQEQDKEEANASLSTAPLPDCPHSEIIQLFAEHLPELPQPRAELWDGQRAKALTARWRWCLTAKRDDGRRYATDRNEAVQWFGKFFSYVRRCPHLMGENDRNWTADLGWLVKAENFAKVQQGNYDNKQLEAA